MSGESKHVTKSQNVASWVWNELRSWETFVMTTESLPLPCAAVIAQLALSTGESAGLLSHWVESACSVLPWRRVLWKGHHHHHHGEPPLLLSRSATRVGRFACCFNGKGSSLEELSWPAVQVGLQIKLKRPATEADVYSSLKLHKVYCRFTFQ